MVSSFERNSYPVLGLQTAVAAGLKDKCPSCQSRCGGTQRTSAYQMLMESSLSCVGF